MSESIRFDRVAGQYDETRGGPARGRLAAADLSPLLGPGPVLEVGVGTGLVVTALREAGHDVYGIDLSPAMLAVAAERIPGRVALADARALPVRTDAVSAVVFVAALHAIRDVPAAMAEAARVLRAGGRVLAVHGPPVNRPGNRDDLATATASLSELRDARPDSTAAVDDAARAAGLTLVEDTITTPMPWYESPADLIRHVENRIWSFLWDLDDAAYHAVADPAIAALRALPDQDRARERPYRARLAVYARVTVAGPPGVPAGTTDSQLRVCSSQDAYSLP